MVKHLSGMVSQMVISHTTISFEEFEKLPQLAVHQPTAILGVIRSIYKGNVSCHKGMGFIQCESAECPVIIYPK